MTEKTCEQCGMKTIHDDSAPAKICHNCGHVYGTDVKRVDEDMIDDVVITAVTDELITNESHVEEAELIHSDGGGLVSDGDGGQFDGAGASTDY